MPCVYGTTVFVQCFLLPFFTIGFLDTLFWPSAANALYRYIPCLKKVHMCTFCALSRCLSPPLSLYLSHFFTFSLILSLSLSVFMLMCIYVRLQSTHVFFRLIWCCVGFERSTQLTTKFHLMFGDCLCKGPWERAASWECHVWAAKVERGPNAFYVHFVTQCICICQIQM